MPWCADFAAQGFDASTGKCITAKSPIANCAVHNVTADGTGATCLFCALNFKPAADSKTCVAFNTPTGAFLTTAGDVSYPSSGWSIVNGTNTFKRNNDTALTNCAVQSADGKSCLVCSVLSGTLADGGKCITAVPAITTIANKPADWTLVQCDTLDANTCWKCATDKRSCLACAKTVTTATCNGANLPTDVIY